jgi:hypothetical protein
MEKKKPEGAVILKNTDLQILTGYICFQHPLNTEE